MKDDSSLSNNTQLVEIVRVRKDHRKRQKDLIVMEEVYSINLNGFRIASLACTPSDLDNLAVGFLFSDRIITSLADIRSLLVKKDECLIEVETHDHTRFSMTERMSYITSGCGSSGASSQKLLELLRAWRVSSKLFVSAGLIASLMKELQRASGLFKLTGGIHSAAVCEPSGIVVMKEDIGRHNAVDKVLGECLMKDISTRDKLLLLTGRVSSDVLVKAALREIPILVSQSAPTHLAVEAAIRSGVTLIGFARGERMNIYSNEWRIE